MPAGRPRDEAQAVSPKNRSSGSSRRPRPAKSTDLRRHAISEQTFYRWKAKYAGLEVNEARRLRTLEHENGRLEGLVADLTLDNQALKELVGKKA